MLVLYVLCIQVLQLEHNNIEDIIKIYLASLNALLVPNILVIVKLPSYLGQTLNPALELTFFSPSQQQ